MFAVLAGSVRNLAGDGIAGAVVNVEIFYRGPSCAPTYEPGQLDTLMTGEDGAFVRLLGMPLMASGSVCLALHVIPPTGSRYNHRDTSGIQARFVEGTPTDTSWVEVVLEGSELH